MKATFDTIEHDKKGITLHRVKFDERLPKAEWFESTKLAKQYGGYYSSYKDKAGYLFPDEESCKRFAHHMTGGSAAPDETPPPLPEVWPPVKEDAPRGEFLRMAEEQAKEPTEERAEAMVEHPMFDVLSGNIPLAKTATVNDAKTVEQELAEYYGPLPQHYADGTPTGANRDAKPAPVKSEAKPTRPKLRLKLAKANKSEKKSYGF